MGLKIMYVIVVLRLESLDTQGLFILGHVTLRYIISRTQHGVGAFHLIFVQSTQCVIISMTMPVGLGCEPYEPEERTHA